MTFPLLSIAQSVHIHIPQSEYYYYYNDAKMYLTLDTQNAHISAKDTFNASQLNNQAIDSFDLNSELNQIAGEFKKFANLKLDSNLTENQYFERLNEFRLMSHVETIQPSFITMDGNQLNMSSFLYVKLNQPSDYNLLQQVASTYNLLIIGQNEFMPLWYTLRLTSQTNFNTLEMANYLHESGDFAATEPDFMFDGYLQCSDDELFDEQWGLSNTATNTGDEGIDIKICEAWEIATGAGIKVAVIDSGIQLDHPDLNNVSALSFDTFANTSPSIIRGDDHHGTAVAGIIAASKDNNIGIAGVAPDATLLSVSAVISDISTQGSQRIANGINWAWENGADVINNSWEGGPYSTIISDAISKALNDGRNGLGAIVVFSSGNANSNIRFPGNTDERITVVGAISTCGLRKSLDTCNDGETLWGSNYGNKLDVVAPGVLITSTDITGNNGSSADDYMPDFGGTSASAPFVSGVAALILSVNPELTLQEVNNIIELTSQKIGPYTYQVNRPNGNWNNEMGFGLIDAHMAVLFTSQSGNDLIIEGPEVVCAGEQATYFSNYPVDWSFSSASSGYIFVGETQNRYFVTVEGVGEADPNASFFAYLRASHFGTTISKFIECSAPRFMIGYEDNLKVKVSLDDVAGGLPLSDQDIADVQWTLTSGNSSITNSTNVYAEFNDTSFTGTVTVTNSLGSVTKSFFWPDPEICYSLLKVQQDKYQVIDRCNENEVIDTMSIKEIYDFTGNKISDLPISNNALDNSNIGNTGDLQVIRVNVDGQDINQLIIKD